jgi:hypothetical protein
LSQPLPLRFVAREVMPAGSADEAEALSLRPGFVDSGGTAVEGIRQHTSGANGRILRRSETPERIEIEAEADRPTLVVLRDTFAPGWVARVDGSPAPVLRADGRHRAVPIGAGRHRVILSYRAPGLVAGFVLSVASGLVLLLLWPFGAERRRSAGHRRDSGVEAMQGCG